MSVNRSLITPTAHPELEHALRAKLARRGERVGDLGELEPLAVRLGLLQGTLKPHFRAPQLTLFAADHGIAVEGVGAKERHSTAGLVHAALTSQLPLAVFARIQGLELSVVDCGMAEQLPPHARLLARKIAHGTRNSRATAAMSIEQAHAAIRAGMEIADSMPGNVIACAGVGVGSAESAALVMARLTGLPLRDLLAQGVNGPGPGSGLGPGLGVGAGQSTSAAGTAAGAVAGNSSAQTDDLAHLLLVLSAAQGRHREVTDAVEVVAAFGGFELAMMVGVMLVAGGKRHLIVADGLTAFTALLVASRIAPAVTDYCVFCRSHGHRGLDVALAHFGSSSLLELGMDSTDGTGAALAWPLIRSAAALLTEVSEGEDPGPTLPAAITGATAPRERK